MTDNVIIFPRSKLNTPPQSVEEMVADIAQVRHDAADEMSINMIPMLLDVFISSGIDVDQHDYIKDVSMVVEATKSLLYKYYNLEHPFHNMVDTIFEFTYNDDNTVEYTYTIPAETEEE